MRLYQVRVDTYEAATAYRYPVVTHLFHGVTAKEAHGYHDAHREADRFIRECEDKHRFGAQVLCAPVITEGWIEV